jgi:phosphoglycolate phosphatase
MLSKKPDAIVFDWDGTLVDSWPVIHEAINLTLDEMGKEQWTLEQSMARVGKSFRDCFPEFFGDKWPEAENNFYKHFEDIHLDGLEVFEKSEPLLRLAKEKDILLSVVSNQTGQYLREQASHLNWMGYFHKVVGARDAKLDKPALDPLIMALDQSGITMGENVWFVGDAPVDMEIAHKGNCQAILIADHHHEDLFIGYEPHAKFLTLDDLITVVEDWS